ARPVSCLHGAPRRGVLTSVPDYLALLGYWSVPPVATFAMELAAINYLWGWCHLYQAWVPFVPPWRAGSFVSGLCVAWIALASPIDALNGVVLSAHMLQHMLLMMAAPPLILLGAPLVPITRGLSSLGLRRGAGALNWSLWEKVGFARS